MNSERCLFKLWKGLKKCQKKVQVKEEMQVQEREGPGAINASSQVHKKLVHLEVEVLKPQPKTTMRQNKLLSSARFVGGWTGFFNP